MAWHDAQARLVIINKRQFEDHSQNLKLADGTSGNVITNNPTNTQTQNVGP